MRDRRWLASVVIMERENKYDSEPAGLAASSGFLAPAPNMGGNSPPPVGGLGAVFVASLSFSLPLSAAELFSVVAAAGIVVGLGAPNGAPPKSGGAVVAGAAVVVDALAAGASGFFAPKRFPNGDAAGAEAIVV